MSETLLIYYNINQPHQATWSLCNDAGELSVKITTGTLDELSEFAGNRHAVMLLNSQCLHINQLRLPALNKQKMLKAVPYAIEEFIAEDIEDFHFVAEKSKHSDFTAVAGIKKTTLDNIIQIFQDANITVESIIPDALCLPANAVEKQWACLNYQGNSYLQTDTKYGTMISHDILPYLLKQNLQDEDQSKPEKILLFSEQENSAAFEQITSNEIFDSSDIELINIVYNTHPLVIFCANYKQATALNLLQYAYKAKRKTSGYWHHWRLAASLALVWLVLQLGESSYILSDLEQENRITRAEIEKIYKQSFPGSKNVVNPRFQMEQKIKELRDSADNKSQGLLFILAESFGTLTHDKTNITIQSLTFRNNRMEIGLDSKNLQAIENLNKNLNKNKKIKSEITSSSSEKDKVKGNLRIEGQS
jgi:general secretion pathway protein L